MTSLADADVVRLYGFDEILGGAPAAVYSERNVKYLENPYSLSDKGPESMFKQAGGSRRARRSRRIHRKRKATKRKRNH